MAEKPQKIVMFISPKGEVRHTYSPEATRISNSLGRQTTIRRASKVEPSAELSDEAIVWLALCEPDPRQVFIAWPRETIPTADAIAGLRSVLMADYWATKWWADMLPSGGPVLGPYDDRDTALEAEIAWLQDNQVPEVLDAATLRRHATASFQGSPLTVAEAEAWLHHFLQEYPAVARWMAECRKRYSDEGWIKTQFGRHKRFGHDKLELTRLHIIAAARAFRGQETSSDAVANQDQTQSDAPGDGHPTD